MIYELSKAVATDLAARKIPVDCYFGAERFGMGHPRAARVAFEHATGNADAFVPPTGAGPGRQPKRWSKAEAITITIGGRSGKPGAREADHKAAVSTLVDAVLVSLLAAAHAESCGVEQVVGGFQGTDSPDFPIQDAAIYVAQALIVRGVKGDAADVATDLTASTVATVKQGSTVEVV